MITVRMTGNRFPQAKQLIGIRLQQRLIRAAEALRLELVQALENGRMPVHADTQALSQSLYVQTPGGSDYGTRLNAARNAYENNASRWRDVIRDLVSADAYTDQHFMERVAAEEPLPGSGNPEAAVATMLAYGAWWEFGHQNYFTKHFEHRAWMLPVAEDFYIHRMSAFFRNLLT